MIVSDIVTRVKRQFGDESGVQVTDADIFRWINDGQRQIVMQNEGLLEAVGLSSTTINVQEYSMPVDLLIFRSLFFKNTGETAYHKLLGYSKIEFDTYVDGFDDTAYTGIPQAFTIFAGKFHLFPIPSATITNSLKIYYNRKPTDIVDGTSTPDIPLLYHESLVRYCLQQAYELDEDWDAATAKATELNADITLLRGRDEWRQQDKYPVITVMPEDEW